MVQVYMLPNSSAPLDLSAAFDTLRSDPTRPSYAQLLQLSVVPNGPPVLTPLPIILAPQLALRECGERADKAAASAVAATSVCAALMEVLLPPSTAAFSRNGDTGLSPVPAPVMAAACAADCLPAMRAALGDALGACAALWALVPVRQEDLNQANVPESVPQLLNNSGLIQVQLLYGVYHFFHFLF